MQQRELDALRNDLSLKAKNGIDFTIAATIIWALIAYIWSLKGDSYNKAVLVFIAGAPLLPLAFGLSKVLKTQWKIEDNPLQPLGLILNFAQLFYFPFLIFVLLRHPDYFVMTYAIITGAHFFPYSWFYKTISYAIVAGLISLGSLLIALNVAVENQYYVGVWVSACLLVLTFGLVGDYRRKQI
jgi:hypothetical protein